MQGGGRIRGGPMTGEAGMAGAQLGQSRAGGAGGGSLGWGAFLAGGPFLADDARPRVPGLAVLGQHHLVQPPVVMHRAPHLLDTRARLVL